MTTTTNSVKETMDGIWARKAENIAKKKEREEKKENGTFVNTLLVEMMPTGLYKCRYELGGPVPSEFDGLHTSIVKVKALAIRRWGSDEKIKVA